MAGSKLITSLTSETKRTGGREKSSYMLSFNPGVSWELLPDLVLQLSSNAMMPGELVKERQSGDDSHPSSIENGIIYFIVPQYRVLYQPCLCYEKQKEIAI